ncbi:MAG: hypothetical protein AB1698_01595 [Pseudomonadota bacterium]
MTDETQTLSVRLSLALAFARMMEKAFDALLYHGVNYRSLPEYQNMTALDEANALPLKEGRRVVMGWLQRMESGIAAAIRRKSFRKV